MRGPDTAATGNGGQKLPPETLCALRTHTTPQQPQGNGRSKQTNESCEPHKRDVVLIEDAAKHIEHGRE